VRANARDDRVVEREQLGNIGMADGRDTIGAGGVAKMFSSLSPVFAQSIRHCNKDKGRNLQRTMQLGGFKFDTRQKATNSG
jgi:hypothetical protein